MSAQNKFAGTFGKSGDVASGGKGVQGNNVYKAPAPKSPSMAKTGPSQNVIKMKTGPGDNMGTKSVSTHNDINTFTRGIKSRGPYGGPSFSSFNTSKQNMQRSNTSQTSVFSLPSGSTASRGSAGGSGKGMTGPSKKVGSGQAVASRGKFTKTVHTGSGHQAGLGRKRV